MKTYKVWFFESHHGNFLVKAENADEVRRKFEDGDYEDEMQGINCIDHTIEEVEEDE